VALNTKINCYCNQFSIFWIEATISNASVMLINSAWLITTCCAKSFVITHLSSDLYAGSLVCLQCVVMKVLVTISGRLYCKVIFKIVSFLEEHEDGFIYDSFFTPTIFVAIFWGSLRFSLTIRGRLFNAGSALTLCWKLTRCFTSCISVYFTENFREENSYWSKQDFWRNIFKLI
jgi:hypothetical protein